MTKTIKLMLLGIMVIQVSSCLLIISTMQTVPVGFMWAFWVGVGGFILGMIGYFRRDRPAQTHAQPAQPAQSAPPATPEPPKR